MFWPERVDEQIWTSARDKLQGPRLQPRHSADLVSFIPLLDGFLTCVWWIARFLCLVLVLETFLKNVAF